MTLHNTRPLQATMHPPPFAKKSLPVGGGFLVANVIKRIKQRWVGDVRVEGHGEGGFSLPVRRGGRGNDVRGGSSKANHTIYLWQFVIGQVTEGRSIKS